MSDESNQESEVDSDGVVTTEEVSPPVASFTIRADLYDEEYSEEEYAEMMQLYEGTLQSIVEGEIVKSKVLRITDSHVILDVGFKSEGAVPLDEFKSSGEIAPGDEVEVFLENLEDEDGAVVLSKKKADFMRVWEKIREAHEAGQTVEGILQKKIKGGVVVDLMGVDAFLPGSQIALRRVPNIDDLLGQKFEFKIIKLNKRRRNIVVSRRVILEADRATKRESLMKDLAKDQVRVGTVKNITDFGAFIDLGGVDGLLHITDMSYGRVSHPSELVTLGQDIEVKILDIDWDRERISLGLKQLQDYPWQNVAERYPVGSRIQGKVVSITNYGAFVELEPGIEGLVHISEMSWTRNVKHPSALVSIGESIDAVVLSIDAEEEKISLGIKQTEQDPWVTLPLKYPLQTRISGKVRNLTSFGAFVEIEQGIDGLIHISDMSWTMRVEHPSEILKKGDSVEVMILSIDPDNKRISLGLKQAQDDPWLKIAEDYPVDKELQGRVVRYQDKGIVVNVGNQVEGFVPPTQLPFGDDKPIEDLVTIGQIADVKVVEVDPINQKIVFAAFSFTDPPEPDPAPLSAEDEAGQESGSDGDEAPAPAKAAENSLATTEVVEDAPVEKAVEEPVSETLEESAEEDTAPKATASEADGDDGEAEKAAE